MTVQSYVFDPRGTNRGMQLHRRRDIESARSLIGEWMVVQHMEHLHYQTM